MNGCILAATDGETSSLEALRCARDLGQRMGLPVELVSVYEPSNSGSGAQESMLAGDRRGDATRQSREAAVLRQMPEGLRPILPIHIEEGIPERTIQSLATERSAELIVIGREGRAGASRLLHQETGPRLIQRAHVPVVTVPEDYCGLPARGLVAIDFTSQSLDAACTVARLLPSGAELHLVHVISGESGVALPSPATAEWVRAMRQEVESRMEEVAHQIRRAAPHVSIAVHFAEGRPTRAILALAEELDADIVAAGTSGYGFLGRLLMGSVATQLIRRTRRMTLIAPPRGIVPRCEARWERLFAEGVAAGA